MREAHAFNSFLSSRNKSEVCATRYSLKKAIMQYIFWEKSTSRDRPALTKNVITRVKNLSEFAYCVGVVTSLGELLVGKPVPHCAFVIMLHDCSVKIDWRS